MKRSRKEAFWRLHEIARTQQGLFTTRQAIAAGFARSTHAYHVGAGNWVRQHRGIYRLALFLTAGSSGQSDLMLGQLWSVNREGRIEGVYSHQTALSLHGLRETSEPMRHMTVSKRFRRSNRPPKFLTLHFARLAGRGDLAERDIVTAQGFRCTGPLRTILDLIAADVLPRDVLRDTLLQMMERDMISREDLNRAKIPLPQWIQFEQLAKMMGKR